MLLINQLFRNVRNQRSGKMFESIFALRARMFGLTVIENGQKVRWLPGGQVAVSKCQLDFTVLSAGRQVAFLDTKAVVGASMAYSAFDRRQLSLAQTYAEMGFVAGFVVLFRQPDVVSFFSAEALAAVGPRQSAKPSESNALGTLASFDPSKVFSGSLT